MPKVSVVMASYNHASFVQASLESALNQSLQDIEVLVTDDGSSDDSVEIIRAIGDARVRLEAFPENRGASAATNASLARASGEYVAILNSDDYFLPGKLAIQAAYLDAHPGVAVVFGLPQLIDEDDLPYDDPEHPYFSVFQTTNREPHEWLHWLFVGGNCFCHPTVMLRREVYDRVGNFDVRLVQLPDFDFWVRVCSAFRVHVMDTPLTAFRILDREGNASGRSPQKRRRGAWEHQKVLRRYASFPEALLRRIFAAEIAQSPPLDHPDIRVVLARLCLSHGRFRAHMLLGLDLLHECLDAESVSPLLREYTERTGIHDVFDINGREQLNLAHQKILLMASSSSAGTPKARGWLARIFNSVRTHRRTPD